MNMASNYQEGSDEGSNQSSESCSEFSDSDTDSEAATDSASDNEAAAQTSDQRKVCMHYNRGNCRFGDKCRNEHICSYFLKGSCKYGAGCRLNHNLQSSSAGQRRQASRDSSADTDEECDGPYRWQLNFGKGWENISNDHILEAQYSLPNTKGIKIYNTRAGYVQKNMMISIDFTKMRVLQKKNIKVRRMNSKDTEWLWYYRGDHCWYQYGGKGKKSPIESSKLETGYQSNRRGSVKFTIDSAQYEISFKGMCQTNLSTGHKRRVRRRPKYEQSKSGGLQGIASHMKNVLTPPTNRTPVWQFKGSKQWYTFNNTGGCSVSSADIERCYQQSQKTMNFTVNNDSYTLDFAKMSQVNQSTKAERKIRRVEK
ncbi:protein mono-ADP-ribosyltransferase PARP12 isoform X1 [Megalobrama amblycephala]|uniref:protein mono-ADP-ribosyltransferase PARP12 isoform X1 n=1 Tax=Megalobrama amblycephala TaxID=75352 RepID=UPI0020144B4A|nr:protein mono-ADP-ribosyltransferase PARP12 isoform X1 [Megalobrama amblycephala]